MSKKPAISFQGIKDQATRRAIQAIVEFVRTGDGQTGNPKEAYLKVGDLTDQNILRVISEGVGGAPGGGSGGGGTTTPQPDLTAPSAPENVEVIGGFDSIFIRWDPTNDTRVGFAEVFRHTADARANAVMIGTTQGGLYRDADTIRGVTYYYWVRYVNRWSTIGNWIVSDFNAIEGAPGQTALDPAALLDALTDSITSSQLAESLRTPIQQIPLLEAASAQTISDLNQEILDRIAAIQAEALARETDDDALAAQISTVSSSLTASINALDTDLQGQITANAGSLTTTIARLNNIDGGGLTLEALAAEVETLVVSGGSGDALAQSAYNLAVAVQQRINAVDGGTQTVENLASLVSSLNSTIVDPTTGLSATRTEAIDAKTRLDDLGGGKSAETVASDVVGLAATINDGATGLAAAHQRSTTVEGRLSDVGGTGRTLEVLGVNFDSLSSAFNDPVTGYSALSAAVSQVQTDVSGQGDQITVLTSNYNSLASSLADVAGDVQANATAIGNTNLVVSNIDGTLTAQGDQITQLIADVDGNSAAIQTEATVRATETGELFGRIGMKIDVNGRIIGWALNNDGQQGDFIVAADRFAVGAPGVNSLSFVVDTAANRVVMPGAYIQDATITSAKIQSLAVEKLTGNIATFIQGNFNELASTNFDYTGVTKQGWRLNVNGAHEIYGGAGSIVVADRLQANAVEVIDTIHLRENSIFITEMVDSAFVNAVAPMPRTELRTGADLQITFIPVPQTLFEFALRTVNYAGAGAQQPLFLDVMLDIDLMVTFTYPHNSAGVVRSGWHARFVVMNGATVVVDEPLQSQQNSKPSNYVERLTGRLEKRFIPVVGPGMHQLSFNIAFTTLGDLDDRTVVYSLDGTPLNSEWAGALTMNGNALIMGGKK